MKDEDGFFREEVAKALGYTGDARAVEPLIKALKDEHGPVRVKAEKALDELHWKPKDHSKKALFLNKSLHFLGLKYCL